MGQHALRSAACAVGPKTDEPPEVAEIRLAMLDQIREKSYRSGGKKVFPYNLVHIELRGIEDSRRAVFTGKFFRKYFEQEVRSALRDGGCRYPEDLRVDVERGRGTARSPARIGCWWKPSRRSAPTRRRAARPG